MARHIDPSKIKLSGMTFQDVNNEVYFSLSDVRKAIDQTPTEDVVEVVRCKDCKYWGGVTYGYICHAWSGINTKNYTKPTEYCARGERKMRGNEKVYKRS